MKKLLLVPVLVAALFVQPAFANDVSDNDGPAWCTFECTTALSVTEPDFTAFPSSAASLPEPTFSGPPTCCPQKQ